MKTVVFISLILACTLHTVSPTEVHSPRDIYMFLWKQKLAPGLEPSQEDLVNVAFWWHSLDPQIRERITNAMKNRVFSDREKKSAISRDIPTAVYGTLAMEKGKDVTGVIVFQSCSMSSEGKPGIKVRQEGQGDVVVPYSSMSALQVLEILDQYGITSRILIRRADRKIISGTNAEASELACKVFNRDHGMVDCSRKIKKKIAFGGVQAVLCPNCFRTMEIDWNFCPYCGERLPIRVRKEAEATKE